MKYHTVIGLEIHIELLTKSKLFCNCSTEFGREANSQVCPICLGMPGTLPLLINEDAVKLAVKMVLALNCRIPEKTSFFQKNYWYPDLPKGYQLSQCIEPIGFDGYLNASKKTIRVKEAHLEEDVGKLIHNKDGNCTLIDFNRSGIPLLEIVTQPDIESSEEADDFLRRIKLIAQYLGVSNCNMEEGSLRCDGNLSVRAEEKKELGTKTEVKNMNSFKTLRKALSYEKNRQIELLKKGEEIIQETRQWDEEKGITVAMRVKTESHNVRYFVEPDLPALIIEKDWIRKIREEMDELPQAKKERFIEKYNISDYEANILTSQKPLADYFEESVKHFRKPKLITNWILTELLGRLNFQHLTIDQSPVTPIYLAELLQLIAGNKVSGKMGKEILDKVFQTGKSPTLIVKEGGLTQISGSSELLKFVREVIKENPKTISDYKKGKERAIGFLVGMVMRKTKGRANPSNVNKFLQEELKKL